MRDGFLYANLFDVTGEAEAPDRERVADAALAFLAAGGVVTVTEWATFSDVTREAFQAARARLSALEAAQFARAIVAAQVDAAPAAAAGEPHA